MSALEGVCAFVAIDAAHKQKKRILGKTDSFMVGMVGETSEKKRGEPVFKHKLPSLLSIRYYLLLFGIDVEVAQRPSIIVPPRQLHPDISHRKSVNLDIVFCQILRIACFCIVGIVFAETDFCTEPII